MPFIISLRHDEAYDADIFIFAAMAMLPCRCTLMLAYALRFRSRRFSRFAALDHFAHDDTPIRQRRRHTMLMLEACLFC